MKAPNLFDGLLSLFFPSFCINCGEKTENPYPLCDTCIEEIEEIRSPYCRICGRPLAVWGNNICGGCIKDPPPFKIARSGYVYTGVTREAIHMWKYNQKRSFSKLFTLLFIKAILKSDIPINLLDAVTYVPMTIGMLKKRGFNQTQDIAKYFSRKFKIFLYEGLKKRKGTKEQALLSEKERLKNIKDAFYISSDVPDFVENLLVIDDVYTTGATMREISKTLLLNKKGLNIYIFTLTRGVQ